MNYEHLRQEDAEIFAAMEQELTRQRDHIELIASENFTSPAVMAADGLHHCRRGEVLGGSATTSSLSPPRTSPLRQ